MNTTPDKQITVAEMYTGQKGTIIQVTGGRGLTQRLGSMGLRPGKLITKVSAMLMRGPVTIQVDNTQLAFGFGMAAKIIVTPDSK